MHLALDDLLQIVSSVAHDEVVIHELSHVLPLALVGIEALLDEVFDLVGHVVPGLILEVHLLSLRIIVLFQTSSDQEVQYDAQRPRVCTCRRHILPVNDLRSHENVIDAQNLAWQV